MIPGFLMGLLVAVAYTLVTGKLVITKKRIAYGTPARAAALLGLVPMMLLCAYSVRMGGLANLPGGLGLVVVTLVGCAVLILAVGWAFGEPPRS